MEASLLQTLETLPVTKLSDTEVESFYAYAFAQYGSGNWKEAADVFRVLCTRRPLESRFWFGLGATLQEAGSYQDALHAWAMAALLEKDDPYPHFHAAECCFSLQLSQDASLALKESEKRIEPQSAHPLRPKITLLRQQWRL
jgi:type III secretion system low calcium response chaperone LcrH/SycD